MATRQCVHIHEGLVMTLPMQERVNANICRPKTFEHKILIAKKGPCMQIQANERIINNCYRAVNSITISLQFHVIVHKPVGCGG